jgi:hypothetical protein
MARASRIFIFCLLMIVGTEATKLPDYIRQCSRNEPQFNDCALKSGREAYPRLVKGDRKLGVPVLDPLFVERVSLTHSGLQATSINFTITGMKDADLEAVSFDFDRQIIKLSFKTPRVTLNGRYDIGGRIFGLPMYGQGDYQLVFEGLRCNYSTNYTLSQLADGQQYAVPVDYNVEYDLERAVVHFQNLFNGNKLLGDTMNNLINENWRIVVEDFGKPIFMTLGGIVHQILTSVSQKVPYNELFTK